MTTTQMQKLSDDDLEDLARARVRDGDFATAYQIAGFLMGWRFDKTRAERVGDHAYCVQHDC